MTKTQLIWLVIIVVGAVNYAARLSFIAFFARRDIPPLLAEALKHVPAAMLTAIVVPAVVFVSPGMLDVGLSNPKVLAALVAGVIAWRWRNTLATIGVGMALLWLTQYLVG